MTSAAQHVVECGSADTGKACDLDFGNAGSMRALDERRELGADPCQFVAGRSATLADAGELGLELGHTTSVKHLTLGVQWRKVLYMNKADISKGDILTTTERRYASDDLNGTPVSVRYRVDRINPNTVSVTLLKQDGTDAHGCKLRPEILHRFTREA